MKWSSLGHIYSIIIFIAGIISAILNNMPALFCIAICFHIVYAATFIVAVIEEKGVKS